MTLPPAFGKRPYVGRQDDWWHLNVLAAAWTIIRIPDNIEQLQGKTSKGASPQPSLLHEVGCGSRKAGYGMKSKDLLQDDSASVTASPISGKASEPQALVHDRSHNDSAAQLASFKQSRCNMAQARNGLFRARPANC